jgi:sensor histidine kinase YesM
MQRLKAFWDRSFHNRSYRITLHAGFWLFLLFFWMRENVVVSVNPEQHYSVTLTGVLLALFLFYPLVYLIIPLIQQKKYLPAIFVFSLYYLLAILLRTYHINLIMSWYNNKLAWVVGQDFWENFYNNQLKPYQLATLFFGSIASLLSIIYIPLIIKFIRYAYLFHLNQARLEKENLKLELNFLKAQVNPHLLFNTLNNLQSFIIHNEKEKSVALLQDLADFMRFSLYEVDTDFIPLAREAVLIRNYVAIESVRYEDQVNISYQENIGNNQYQIPPLLLMPLVENAFKHSSNLPATDLNISIDLTCDKGLLRFKVCNSYVRQEPANKSGGIGLQNLKKRINYYFPGVNKLIMEESSNRYMVELEIMLPAI